MSERGSFVTQFIYCGECLEKMKKVLIQDHKYLKGVQVEGWKTEDERRLSPLPIIAGKIGGLYGGEELCEFQFKLFNKENAPCHEVICAVIPDSGTPQFFVVLPDGSVECYEDFKRDKNEEEQIQLEIERENES